MSGRAAREARKKWTRRYLGSTNIARWLRMRRRFTRSVHRAYRRATMRRKG